MRLERNRWLNIYWGILIFLFFAGTYSYTQTRYNWDNIPDQVKERKAFKRFEWFYRQRALPYDTIPEGAIEHARQTELKKELSMPRTVQSANLNWTQLGPTGIVSTYPSQWGVVSGRVRAIAVHPTDPNTVYIGAASGGIWKTTDGGTNWQDIGFNLASLTFGAIGLDPGNPNIVYAGAGESMRFFNLQTYDGKGLYKSTDAGATWTQITNGFGSYTFFSALKVSPTNSNYLFAALGSGYWLGAPSNEGLWRSTNGGVNWTRTLNVNDAFDVLPHPTTAGRVYGAIGGAASAAGFYISTDNGATWTQSNSGLPATSTIDRIQISLATSTPSTIYSLIHSYGAGTISLYKSTDNGSNWTLAYSTSSYGNQGWYDLLVTVNPSNVNEVYIGDTELRLSTNGGTSFSYVGGTYWGQSMHVDFHYLVFAPSNSAYRYVGCDGGIYRSTNSGTSWTGLNSLSTIQYYRLSSHPTNQNIVLGGAQDNGLYKTTNGGSGTWALVSTGDGMESFYDYTNPNIVYASTQNGGLVKSTTGGNYSSFANIKPITGSQPWAWTAPFFIHPSNNQTIYTATDRPWRSTDGGSTWLALTGGAVTSVAINTMAQSPLDANNMILAGSEYTSSPTVHISTNGGTAWTDVTANIGGTARYISRVVFHPLQASTVFVVRSGFSSGNKIYRSTNMGTTWTNISGDLPDVPHNDVFVDPAIPSDIYTANDLGVYRTTNDGVNWIRQGNNFPYVPVQDFDYFSSGGVRILRAGSHGRSAYQAVLLSGPEITSFAPSAGAVGTSVTITGNGFDPTPANNIVYFGGAKASVTASSSTSLTVTVPVGATYGPVSVTVNNLTEYSAAFFIVTFATGSGIIDTASFMGKIDNATGNTPWGIGVCDIDLDGKIDVAVVNSSTASNSVSIFRNTSVGSTISFAPRLDLIVNDNPRNLAFGDIDGDGKLDLAVVRQSSNSVSIFRNLSTPGSVSFASRLDFTVGINPFDVAIGEIDGDGKPDVACANGSAFTILRNTSSVGSISFDPKVDITSGNGTRSIALGDFDGDGISDVTVISVAYSNMSVFRNTSTAGNVSFASAVTYTSGTAPYEVVVSDIDTDGKLDIACVNFTTNNMSVFRNTCTVGNISFDAALNFATGNGPSCLAAENLNGDLKPDMLATNWSDTTAGALQNTSASISFAGIADFPTGVNPYGCISGDLDGDSAPDLLTTNQGSNTMSVLRNRLADSYIITASVVGSGTIDPSGSVYVLHGANQTFTFTPDYGYHFDSLIVDGASVDSLTSYTFYNVTYAHTITAYFTINQYTITAQNVGNGTISPSGSVIVTHGSDQPFTITPAANHHIDSVVVDGVNQGAVSDYDFINVITGHTITAYFSIDTYSILATVTGNGWIIPAGTVMVPHGSGQSFTFGPYPNATFDSLFVDELFIDSISSYTFYNVTQNHTIRAKFLSLSSTITVIQTDHGTITPGTTEVPYGENQAFAITPDVGYHVDSVFADDVYVPDSTTSYTFTNVTANHTLTAKFAINTYALTIDVVGNGAVTRAPDLTVYEHGTSVDLEAIPDDLSWEFTEWSGDLTGSTNPTSIIMDGPKSVTATFEQNAAYLATYRSFIVDSIAFDTDKKGKVGKYEKRKPDKVDFEFYVINPFILTSPGLHVEFGYAIDSTNFPFGTIPPSVATCPDGKMKKWDFAFPTLNSNDTVWVYGFGTKGKPQKISKYYWTDGGALVGSKLKTVSYVRNVPKMPMPNRVNALYETFLYGGYGTTGMVVGQVRNDSNKYFAWFQTLKYKDVWKSLNKKGGLHTGSPHGFDFYVNGKPMKKQQKKLEPTKYNNILFADLAALKFNITASAMGITPIGFGELIYDEPSITGPFDGMMIRDIAAYADSIMMGWLVDTTDSRGKPAKDHRFMDAADPGSYNDLDYAVARINSAFEGELDTVKFSDSLIFAGMKALLDVPYLRANPGVMPAIITPMANIIPQEPTGYSLYQNYPNPFNPLTTIEFDLPTEAFVSLKIYNTLGQEVATLLDNELMSDGTQEIEFDASHLSSGVYFYRIQAESIADEEEGIMSMMFTNVKKMLLLR